MRGQHASGALDGAGDKDECEGDDDAGQHVEHGVRQDLLQGVRQRRGDGDDGVSS